ncbi:MULTISPECIES: dihydrolipoamide acetyltransferase family protein [Streptomycetaceae]|uniref:Dihydrolipoamide acetyltransferase component of pyruvate dehydrogenase complex n=1 Tax=Streptantibioticus cattleyicolor (strain ATCC 35852 / DSM 46488 / JCM 4925 / NBRC 14057 / NRRL 8057) TaxID=1003195 RepID=F8JTM2_STREN|nr:MULTISPECIES: dihydrolipoamide acetyltransferase family protein [Streptomycetaceae]AEW96790.1 pyruvate dehydrogenase complex, E2 component, dihydrolipoamide acetyltransferase [Streptantibioticus cattleyicolor NRRL 8057 = DSM 46488]MYS61270.1 dihydrolipoamide acetyltransferase [Streptomyces sp. SID5468]CCB77119.1 Dihydrolipoyllysine-residue acetyltransferase component of pyruvate dehydrogenase complex [Streptantibioticus cattleyicolor NRRL 8057 = DSM 46488]
MTEILMPRLSDTMEEGVIAAWHKRPGDPVAPGDTLVDIETDKAVMEHEAYEAGALAEILVPEGGTAKIGEPIALLAVAGETVPVRADVPSTPVAREAPEPAPAAPAPVGERDVVRTSPLARRLAREYGVDIAAIPGSGPGGRVVRADVEKAAKALKASEPEAARTGPARTDAAADDAKGSMEAPVSRMRKVAATRLAASKREAPHFYLHRTVDAEALRDFRARVNSGRQTRVSPNDLILKACATALRHHPDLNSSWVDDRLLRHGRVHLGVAVATDDGLLVPVVRDADRLPLTELAARTRELAEGARARTLPPAELSGSTFTVSNLGMFGVDDFQAVINPPEAAILAVGAIRRRPVVVDDAVVPRHTVELTLSVDHRAADGATAARFLEELAGLLEDPLRIVI